MKSEWEDIIRADLDDWSFTHDGHPPTWPAYIDDRPDCDDDDPDYDFSYYSSNQDW